jgi:hypothetical protein
MVVGRAGEAGPAGAAGERGAAGQAGAQGASVPGPVGAMGRAGPAGVQAVTGSTGAQGPTLVGPTGPAGRPGPTGAQGETGRTGAQGSTDMAGVSGPAGSTGAAGPQGPIGPTGAQGPMASAAGWTPYGAYSFDTNSNTIAGSDRGKSREIASYLKQNPSRRVALASSDATRVRIVRSELIAAGVPADRIDSGAYGDAQRRRDGRVEVLFSNEPAPGQLRSQANGGVNPPRRSLNRPEEREAGSGAA